MWDYFVAFLLGFFANWGFAMLSRLLPDTWVRFVIRIGDASCETDPVGPTWSVPITVRPPRWKRVVMYPLQEYLLVEVRVDQEVWVRSKWAKGDINEAMLRADAAMSVPAIVLTGTNSGTYFIADRYAEAEYQVVDPHQIEVRVLRSVDMIVADTVMIPVVSKEGAMNLGQSIRDC